jgi:hypothetical protein
VIYNGQFRAWISSIPFYGAVFMYESDTVWIKHGYPPSINDTLTDDLRSDPRIIQALIELGKTEPPPTSYDNYINFDSLAVGQKSRYLGFTITGDTAKSYQGDTLIVEVIEKTDSGFIFQDYYTKGSASIATVDSIYQYIIQVENDTIIHRMIDYLGYGTRLLWVNSMYWFPTSFTSDGSFDVDTLTVRYCINNTFKGTVDRIDMLNCSFNDLNIINDNHMVSFDGPGYLFVFNKPKGIVYTLNYSAWTMGGRGWEFLPF